MRGYGTDTHTHAFPYQTLLVLLVIGLYGVVGMLLFWQTGLYPADAIENFNTAPSAILSVFVLYSSENYPGKRGAASCWACYAIVTLTWVLQQPTTTHCHRCHVPGDTWRKLCLLCLVHTVFYFLSHHWHVFLGKPGGAHPLCGKH